MDALAKFIAGGGSIPPVSLIHFQHMSEKASGTDLSSVPDAYRFLFGGRE